MGKLEAGAAKELRATKARLAILSVVKAAGFITLAIAAPKAASLLAREFTHSARVSAQSSVRRLIAAGLLEREGQNLRVTPEGARFLDRATVGIPPKKRWDGLWRVVIFDIPKHRGSLRNKLRQTLISVGFLRLQDSVWVHAHDCEDLITLLKTDFRLSRDVIYMIVQKIENDRWIREHFKI